MRVIISQFLPHTYTIINSCHLLPPLSLPTLFIFYFYNPLITSTPIHTFLYAQTFECLITQLCILPTYPRLFYLSQTFGILSLSPSIIAKVIDYTPWLECSIPKYKTMSTFPSIQIEFVSRRPTIEVWRLVVIYLGLEDVFDIFVLVICFHLSLNLE